MGLKATDVLGLENWSVQHFREPLVSLLGDASVVEWILVPKEPRLVASLTHLQRITKRSVLAGRITHKVNPVTDAIPELSDGRRFHSYVTSVVATAPTVHIEAGVAHLETLLGKVGKRFRAVQAAVLVAV